MSSMTLTEMAKNVEELATAKGWRRKNGSPTTVVECVAWLHSEVSEVLEAYRDYGMANTHLKDGKPEGVGNELADILIRLIDMARLWGIDLDREFAIKMAYNWTRPYGL